jgi:hypothetical protein
VALAAGQSLEGVWLVGDRVAGNAHWRAGDRHCQVRESIRRGHLQAGGHRIGGTAGAGLGLLVIDGYADLDPGGRPGLGAHAHRDFVIPVIGVAKSVFRTATHAIPVLRGSSARPLFVTAAGIPGPTPRSWCGSWPAGSGYPTHCAVPTSSPAPAHRERQVRTASLRRVLTEN